MRLLKSRETGYGNEIIEKQGMWFGNETNKHLYMYLALLLKRVVSLKLYSSLWP